MDKAKAAITDFMGRSGHHDTTVHEAVAPAVTQETIKPHVHEEVNTAIDKEVHQDHYHRTVQPVQDREVLPEKHEAKIGAVQHREFDHRDHDSTKRNLVAEQAQFKDERRIDATSHSQSVAPVVGGEHVHHHIHETIQPVVQKETIQPSVVHTTVPIHEVHHNKATHHETTALPAMTMDQFKSKGGSLTGREERYDEFEGVPKNIGSSTAGGLGAVSGLAHKEGHHSHAHGTANPLDRNNDGKVNARDVTGSSTTHSTTHGTANPLDRNNDGRVDARDTGVAGQGNLAGSSTQGGILGNNAHSGTSHTGVHHGTDGVIGGTRNDSDRLAHRDNEDGAHKKPGLMAKLNPKVDADGDGKAGFMK
ncbi:hypothetical protein T440DRAFT_463762 [Plenodomus tracheiphilus IPT5]|uniref:Allergen n=1 Tax=Plenodomus tracheiphilus IPT5 TaxID=1408161 RepID=A0A6A7BNK8_9PLEO|nr:hypothetical protein T440DRAFT_463762 [Plenodomus tracheiphilus IPT5]